MRDLLNRAFQLHERGRLDEAAVLYRDILAVQPAHPEALHLLGVVAHQRGDHARAVELIGRALAGNPRSAVYHANLAEAYRALGRLDEAVAHGRTALRLQPDHADAVNNLGLALLAQNQFEPAIELFRTALRLRPGYALACGNLGNALRLQGDIAGALTHFRQAVQIDPNLAEGHSNLGQLLLEQKQPHEALVHCRHAVRLRPHFPEAHGNLGNVLREVGRLDTAKQCYAEALRLNPNLAMLYNNMAQALQEEGKLDEALAWYNRGLELDPHLGRLHANLASLFAERDNHSEAISHYEIALRLDPEYAEAHTGLGQVREELGDFTGAEQHLRAAIRHDPRLAGAWGQLATLLRGKLPDDDLQAMHHLLADPDLTPGKRAALRFGMAQALDARKQFDEAGEHLVGANALALSEWRKRGQGYDPADHARFVDQLLAAFSPAFFERAAGLGVDTERPIFIVGLPRSGTTLTEQILASHSNVFGAGELNLARENFLRLAGGSDETLALQALSRLDRGTVHGLARWHLDRLRRLHETAPRVADKMPDNYLHLGLLAVLFPRAKFVHCRRDLRDVAVSCWMTSFRSIRWASDPDHIAARFREYQRVMEHWRKVLPVPLLEVDYEDTVTDLEGVARRLVEFCGLEWEPACLNFHEGKRPVRTASVTQVRQPIYQRSVARWKHYHKTLGRLFDRLQLEPAAA